MPPSVKSSCWLGSVPHPVVSALDLHVLYSLIICAIFSRAFCLLMSGRSTVNPVSSIMRQATAALLPVRYWVRFENSPLSFEVASQLTIFCCCSMVHCIYGVVTDGAGLETMMVGQKYTVNTKSQTQMTEEIEEARRSEKKEARWDKREVRRRRRLFHHKLNASMRVYGSDQNKQAGQKTSNICQVWQLKVDKS